MPAIAITCPYCGFVEDTSGERLPLGEIQITCPNCKRKFPFNPRRSTSPENTSCTASSTPTITSVQSISGDQNQPLITDLAINQGGAKAKQLLILFALFVVILVGVRLWADSKKQSVLFPNFIATSTQEVAVTWGQEIYFLNHVGKVLRTQSLPADVVPTQLKYVGGELWIADYAGKTINRVTSTGLHTVVNGRGQFRGAFKFAVDLQTGEVFVTDASNHKVHIYSMDGRYLKSFGAKGKRLAELMFPNTLVFDEKGRLLIVNTNAQRIDIYERDGEFVDPYARIQPQGAYRYPTLMAQAGNRVALLLTVDLREAKAVVYRSNHQYAGELVTPKPLQEAGDVAALNGKILLSDNKERRVYSFAVDTLAYLGPFSAELDALGDKALGRVALYASVANGALILLLAACLPILFLYLRMRRRELQAIAATDYHGLFPEETFLTTGLNRRKMISGFVVLVLPLLLSLGIFTGWITSPSISLLLLLGSVTLAIVGWMQIAITSGYADPARKETLVRLVKSLYGKVSLILTPGECVETCTAVRLNLRNNQQALLLCTNRRLLVIDLSVKIAGLRQIGYGNIAASSLEPVEFSSWPFKRLLAKRYFKVNLAISADDCDSTLQFAGTDYDLLDRLRYLLETRMGKGERLGVSVLCDTCFRPLGSNGCPICTAGKKENWMPLILSCIYPGLGQFYNRELIRGTLASAVFSAGIISLVIPVTKMVDRSAEFTSVHVNLVAQNIAGLLFLYAVCCLDADQLGRKGRKLLSAATGDAASAWLRARIARMRPSWQRLLIELVPGFAHMLAGSYMRDALFILPTGYLFWMTCWSLMAIASGHEVTLDFYVLGYGSALTAVLWVGMNIDGIRKLERQPALKITGRGVLSMLGIPCLTFIAAIIAQLLQEKLRLVHPSPISAMSSFLRHIHMLVLGLSGYDGLFATMFLGWGGAIMAMFSAIAWQSGRSRGNIVKAALAGLCCGAVCWTLCVGWLGGALGSIVLVPVAFGLTIGLSLFLYFRKNGASVLLIPAVMAGGVIGNVATISGVGVIILANRLVAGHFVSLMFSVAIPAYFMHLAYQIVERALPTTGKKPMIWGIE